MNPVPFAKQLSPPNANSESQNEPLSRNPVHAVVRPTLISPPKMTLEKIREKCIGKLYWTWIFWNARSRGPLGSGNPWHVFPDFEERRAFSTRKKIRENEFRKNRWKVYRENSLKFTLVFTEYWFLYCERRKPMARVLSKQVPDLTN